MVGSCICFEVIVDIVDFAAADRAPCCVLQVLLPEPEDFARICAMVAAMLGERTNEVRKTKNAKL